MNGKMVKEEKLSGDINLEVDGLAKGVYLLKIYDAGRTERSVRRVALD
jgi:hypothetical protein